MNGDYLGSHFPVENSPTSMFFIVQCHRGGTETDQLGGGRGFMSMSMDIELPVANEGFEFDGKFQADPQP